MTQRISEVEFVTAVRLPLRRQERAKVAKASAELTLSYDAGMVWLVGPSGRRGVPFANVASIDAADEKAGTQDGAA